MRSDTKEAQPSLERFPTSHRPFRPILTVQTAGALGCLVGYGRVCVCTQPTGRDHHHGRLMIAPNSQKITGDTVKSTLYETTDDHERYTNTPQKSHEALACPWCVGHSWMINTRSNSSAGHTTWRVLEAALTFQNLRPASRHAQLSEEEIDSSPCNALKATTSPKKALPREAHGILVHIRSTTASLSHIP